MEEFLLKVAPSAKGRVAEILLLSQHKPDWVRVATLQALSNYGYPPDVDGWLVGVNERGIVVGVEGREDVPRDFVPWSAVCYFTDGTQLAKAEKKK